MKKARPPGGAPFSFLKKPRARPVARSGPASLRRHRLRSFAGANSVPRCLRTLAWRGSVAGFARSARSHARPAALWLPFMPSVVGSATIPRITSTANSALTTASSLSCRFPKSSFPVQLLGVVLHPLAEGDQNGEAWVPAFRSQMSSSFPMVFPAAVLNEISGKIEVSFPL